MIFTVTPVPVPDDKYWYQYVVAFSASLIMLSCGIAIGWPSPTMPTLLAKDSPLSSDESGWIVTTLMFGRMLSPLPSAWMMDKYGRKSTLILSSLPIIIGLILISMAKSVFYLYVGRVLCGFTYGAVCGVTLPMYLGEIASDKIRGSVSVLMGVSLKLGIFLVYAIGPNVSKTTLGWFALVPPVLFVLIFMWMPESPYYLVGKLRPEQALHALTRLRGHTDVIRELDKIEVTVRKSEANIGTYQQLLAHENRQCLVIILGLSMATILTGTEAVMCYSELIFDKVGSEIDGNQVNVMLGALLVTTTVLALITVDRFGRRPLLLYSSLGLALSNSTIAAYFLCSSAPYSIATMVQLAWLPMVAVVVFVVSYGMGLATVTFALVGEIVPKNLKASAGVLFGMVVAVLSFVVTKSFQIVSDQLGAEYMFAAFAVSSGSFYLFVLYVIPETKRKPLDLILVELGNK